MALAVVRSNGKVKVDFARSYFTRFFLLSKLLLMFHLYIGTLKFRVSGNTAVCQLVICVKIT